MQNFRVLLRYLATFYFGAQIGWPLGSKLVFLFFTAVLLVTGLSRPVALSRKSVVLILFAVFLLLPFSLGMLRTNWSSSLASLVIGVVLRDLTASRVYKVVLALAVFVLLQFSQNHNHAAIATWTNNERDTFDASRLFGALQAHVDDQVQSIYVVGRINTPRRTPFAMPLPKDPPPFGQAFIIGECAVLNCQPRHLLNAIRSVSYFPFTAEIIEVRPGEYRQEHPDGPTPAAFWPSENAIVRDGENVYLFL